MDLSFLKYVGAGLMSIGMLGAAVGIGHIFAALISSAARNPEVENKLLRLAFIGAALAEAMGLFSFIIAILLIYGQ